MATALPSNPTPMMPTRFMVDASVTGLTPGTP
jgi:hypothetical protein